MRALLLFTVISLVLPAQPFAQTQGFLKGYCVACHQGAKPSGGFNAAKLTTL